MKKRSLSVTILMPIYNVENYLERSLMSVFKQTYQNVDYIFVDDCSSDNSLSILYKCIEDFGVDENRCKIISHEYNKGIAYSRSEILKQAKGDYVYFVDSDDWIEPEAIEMMMLATNEGEIDIIGCDFYVDCVNMQPKVCVEDYGFTCRENMIKCLNYDIATVLWKLLIKRSVFDNFDISMINIGEDYIISIKLFFFADSFFYLHKAFYHYSQYNPNRLSLQTLRSILDHVKCVKEVESFLREKKLYYGIVENNLNLRKFNIISNFVLNKELLSKVSYETIFPEVRGYWHKINYSWREKVKFWLADRGLFFFLKYYKM